ncbi:hypothetical protein [Mesoterricola sediminis]|uniref:Uncharacterized protein n=1 Tax=Mesoterricola sediminis TaxID=2927980 RepID=A0AA48KDC7_9BACT|nr:hypothetical protein [Mesoterricola sediminis]BDU76940.1 hypothetical protein METESE_18980 [Mesoterricola sediminis]
MPLRIRTPLAAACLVGLAAVPTQAAGPVFSVAFTSVSGALTQTQVQAPTRIQIEERPATPTRGGRHILKLTFQDDGTNLPGRLRQALASGDPVSAVVTFSADSGPLAAQHTRLTLGNLSRVAGWNDEDDDPACEDDGQIQIRCEYTTFSAQRVAPPPPPGDATGLAGGGTSGETTTGAVGGDTAQLPGGTTGTTTGTTTLP